MTAATDSGGVVASGTDLRETPGDDTDPRVTLMDGPLRHARGIDSALPCERGRRGGPPELSRLDRHTMTDHSTTTSTVPFAHRSAVATGAIARNNLRATVAAERGESGV